MSFDKRAFSEVEASHYICMSRSFLRQARMNGTLKARTPGPRFIRIGRAIRYLKDDLDQWLDKHVGNQHSLENEEDRP